MTGTHSGALKAKQTILAKDKDFYRKIGRLGGMTETFAPKGFACDIERARKAGAKAGSISKKEMKYLGEKDGCRNYLENNTGKVVKYKYDTQSKRYVRSD